ncbi:hypothetical protein J27TS7_34210 [Paenibacillus dendritiformis]|uniref:BC1872 family protein n=1 Tax=Paenibacillus dendritiformis TaxID=130049 RepID=UPI001B2CC132|nr:hypothetical protein [Paenibacillus dendritiformis]GIO73907.1 hypothetical protein J27TS7_34210 [Paenibacillus dendritiformis]
MKYTEEQIEAMSGTELDTLAEELVFGAKPDPGMKGWVKIGELSTYPNSYSNNIAAAMFLLETMISKGAEVNIGYFEEWDCSIDYPIGCNWRMTGKTAAEAVTRTCCLAAAMTGGHKG